jgi:hypothetical protein
VDVLLDHWESLGIVGIASFILFPSAFLHFFGSLFVCLFLACFPSAAATGVLSSVSSHHSLVSCAAADDY